MMNANDARKVIDALTSQPFVCSDNFIETNGYVIITKERYNKCEAALEKQTPKKPFYTIPFYNCPKCKNDLYENQKYCENCGQALDWS